MLKHREYRSGTNWCFWRWTHVPTNYIVRLHLVKTPWFAICLHWLNHPDPEPCLHDHPVSFLSIILRGGYSEILNNPFNNKKGLWGYGINLDFKDRKWINWVRATTAHSIVSVIPGTLTLCLMGPKTREWGFYTKSGWTHWKEYNDKKYKETTA